MLQSIKLPDVQQTMDTRGISLEKVGICDLRLPIEIKLKSEIQNTVANISANTSLDASEKGTHMSRFVEEISNWTESSNLCKKTLVDLVSSIKTRLNANNSQVKIDFPVFIKKYAPISGQSSRLAVDCSYNVEISENNIFIRFQATLPISNACPCSKAISEYGAHNQRSIISAKLILDSKDNNDFDIESLIEALEESSSSPVFPLLKRQDEKYVTERQYDNPKFVEDLVRDAIINVKELSGIKSFEISATALESIHGHNAFASSSFSKG